jgi:hypothetical protein
MTERLPREHAFIRPHFVTRTIKSNLEVGDLNIMLFLCTHDEQV